MSVPDPHACLNGYVYLGYTAEDEGEIEERVQEALAAVSLDGRGDEDPFG
jgi:hypothetical protein